MKILKNILACSFFLLLIYSCANDSDGKSEKDDNSQKKEYNIDSITAQIIIDDVNLDFDVRRHYRNHDILSSTFYKECADSLQWNTLIDALFKKLDYKGLQKPEEIYFVYLYAKNVDSIFNLDSIGGISLNIFAKDNSLHHRLYKNTDGKFQIIPEANAEVSVRYIENYNFFLDNIIYPDANEDDSYSMFMLFNNTIDINYNEHGLHRIRQNIENIKNKNKKD